MNIRKNRIWSAIKDTSLFEIFNNVFIGELAFVFLPFFVIVVVKSFFLDTPFEEFAYSSKLSFAIVILYASIITKFVDLKIRYQKSKDFTILLGGIKFYILFLIGAVILLIFVVIDEQRIVEISEQRRKLYVSLHISFILIAVFDLIVKEISAKLTPKSYQEKRETKEAYTIIEEIRDKSDDVNDKLHDLKLYIEITKLKTDYEDEKINSKSLIESRKQENDIIEKRISNICDSVNNLLISFKTKRKDLETIKTTHNKVQNNNTP